MNDDENEIENDDDLNKQVVFCANDKNIAEFECSDCSNKICTTCKEVHMTMFLKNHFYLMKVKNIYIFEFFNKTKLALVLYA